MSKYYQCKLQRGNEVTTGWIEERGCRIGAFVELIGHGEALWKVMTMNGPPMTKAALQEKQRMDRGSLGSIKA